MNGEVGTILQKISFRDFSDLGMDNGSLNVIGSRLKTFFLYSYREILNAP